MRLLFLFCWPIFAAAQSSLPPTLSASSSEVNWVVTTRSPAQERLIYIYSQSGRPVTMTVPVTTWMTATINGLLVMVYGSPQAAGVGVHTSSLTFRAEGLNETLVIPVRMTVTAPPPSTFSVSPQSLKFTWEIGSPPPPAQSVSITGSNVNGFATGVGSAGWLRYSPTYGNVPSAVSVSVTTNGLAAGTYSSLIPFLPVEMDPVLLPVTLEVTQPRPRMSVNPVSVLLTCEAGTAELPPRTITVTGVSSSNATATSSGWLSVTPLGPTHTMSIRPGALAAGTYTGRITITSSGAANSPLEIPVTLTVNPNTAAEVTPQAVALAAGEGSSTVLSARLEVTGVPGKSYSANADQPWVQIQPASGVLPAAITVRADASTLPLGSSTAIVIVQIADASNSPLRIPVTVTRTQASPELSGIADSGSFRAGAISSGSLISLSGNALSNSGSSAPRPGTPLPTELGGSRVLISGTPAPLLFANPRQLNAIVPFGIAPGQPVAVVLERNGVRYPVGTVNVVGAAPALFSADGSGRGQAAAINEDYGLNSAAGARPGSVIMLYATGLGTLSPPLRDGTIAGETLSHAVRLVEVDIGGRPANVLYSGSSPGLAAGVGQINVQVPAGAPNGGVPVVVRIGGRESQEGMTILIDSRPE